MPEPSWSVVVLWMASRSWSSVSELAASQHMAFCQHIQNPRHVAQSQLMFGAEHQAWTCSCTDVLALMKCTHTCRHALSSERTKTGPVNLAKPHNLVCMQEVALVTRAHCYQVATSSGPETDK